MPRQYFSWERSGLAVAGSSLADDKGRPQDAAQTLSLGLNVTGLARTVSQNVTLAGPGDIAALDADLIIRRVPEPQATDAVAGHFPFVEFSRTDLPWLFTPANPSPAEARLMPWLVLVVVGLGETVRLGPSATGGHVLSIDAGAGAILPDLSQAYAWAHVDEAETGVAVARMMCPVRMLPATRYTACLVPAFAAGVAAGLGRAAMPGTDLAWQTATEAVTLPVYHHWSFTTGPAGAEFEALALRLEAVEADATVGLHDLDITTPGAGLDADDIVPGWSDRETVTVSFSGALVSPIASPKPWKAAHRTRFRSALRDRLNAQITVAKDTTAERYDPLRDDPVVGLPRYGVWLTTGQENGVEPLAEGGWSADLNLDPRHRAQAGVGAAVVRKYQEELMTEAWTVISQADEIGIHLAQSRMAQAVGLVLHRRLSAQSVEALAQVTTYATRDTLDAVQTIVRAETVPPATFTARFRRDSVRADTTLRRLRIDTDSKMQMDITSMCFTGDSSSAVLTLRNRFDGLVSNLAFTQNGVAMSQRIAPERAERRLGDIQLRQRRRSRRATPLYGSILLEKQNPPPRRSVFVSPDTSALQREILTALDPDMTVTEVARARLPQMEPRPGSRVPIPDRVDAAFEFEAPAYIRLASHAPELLLPGYGGIPEHSVTLLNVNAAFVESYLAGLCHEMSRELAWRQFPADLRGTWFRRFWDYADNPTTPERKDISPIDRWDLLTSLGENPDQPGLAQAATVVMFKSPLFRRYPETRVYLAPAVWDDAGPGDDLANPFRATGRPRRIRRADMSRPGILEFPIFEGQIGRNGAFFGFTRTAHELRGQPSEGAALPGYFVVLEQPRTAPRFGLDEPPENWPIGAPRSSNELSWAHFAADASALADLRHAPLAADWKATPVDGMTWGDSAAVMARLTCQNPVRVMIHADAIIADEVAP